MSTPLRVALIGLDTSHAIEFTRRMQGTDCPPGEAVEGLQAVTCLRFASPFQNEEGLDARQKTLESWGVRVTPRFDEAVADCDAIMLEINDPALHREYFERCAGLGKPVFLDKPLADTLPNGRQIAALAEQRRVPLFSASSLRYDRAVVAAARAMPAPRTAIVWGPLGTAPAGSSIVWYGVHAFEMLQLCLGRGAAGVHVVRDANGLVACADYADGRRGVVELTTGAWRYGGVLRDHQNPEVPFSAAGGYYGELMKQVAAFFRGGVTPLPVADTLEVMGLLDAAERSAASGRREAL